MEIFLERRKRKTSTKKIHNDIETEVEQSRILQTQNENREQVRKKRGKGFKNGGRGGEKENGKKMGREERANHWDGFKISMVENVSAASVPSSIEGRWDREKTAVEKWHRHKGTCVNGAIVSNSKAGHVSAIFVRRDFSRYSDQ